MQIVFTEDNLHEILKPVFWRKKIRKKDFEISSAENFTQIAKR